MLPLFSHARCSSSCPPPPPLSLRFFISRRHSHPFSLSALISLSSSIYFCLIYVMHEQKAIKKRRNGDVASKRNLWPCRLMGEALAIIYDQKKGERSYKLKARHDVPSAETKRFLWLFFHANVFPRWCITMFVDVTSFVASY